MDLFKQEMHLICDSDGFRCPCCDPFMGGGGRKRKVRSLARTRFKRKTKEEIKEWISTKSWKDVG